MTAQYDMNIIVLTLRILIVRNKDLAAQVLAAFAQDFALVVGE